MLRRWRKNTQESNEFFLKNGGAVLEQVVRHFNGRGLNPIRTYSSEDLDKATRNFRLEIHRDSDYIMYRGTDLHDGREILVKKFEVYHSDSYTRDDQLEAAAKDIAISSRMSSHRNVLRLLGCCVDTELPILVYEFPANENLGTYLCGEQSELTWDQKLKIAIGVANAIAYLHRGLPNAFVHSDVKPRNVFLDGSLTAKLTMFQLAKSIPEGEKHVDVKVIDGTFGFMAPEAFLENRYTEKSDVFAFGALMCEVLTRKEIRELLFQWHDRRVSGEFRLDVFVRDVVEEHCRAYLEDDKLRIQVMEYVNLMQRCLQENAHDRPDIVEAEKALRLITHL